MLRSKIHRATVTEANVDYEGSITIDPDLMDAAISPFEQVHVLDIDNGARLTTYAIEGLDAGRDLPQRRCRPPDRPGDLVIILAYDQVPESEARDHRPTLVYVDADNRIARIGHDIPVGVS